MNRKEGLKGLVMAIITAAKKGEAEGLLVETFKILDQIKADRDLILFVARLSSHFEDVEGLTELSLSFLEKKALEGLPPPCATE